MLKLGFSSEIPFLLVYVTQSAWLSEAKISIETIGLISELKFVWAPFLKKNATHRFSAHFLTPPPLDSRFADRHAGTRRYRVRRSAQWLGYTVAFSLAS